MSPEKQRIAIAEACGWKPNGAGYWRKGEVVASLDGEPADDECIGIGGEATPALPDYPNDLNAMADALAYIQDRKNEYGQWIIAILTHDWPEEDVENVQKLTNAICTSIAAQWAEAFLRTIGKWEEE